MHQKSQIAWKRSQLILVQLELLEVSESGECRGKAGEFIIAVWTEMKDCRKLLQSCTRQYTVLHRVAHSIVVICLDINITYSNDSFKDKYQN